MNSITRHEEAMKILAAGTVIPATTLALDETVSSMKPISGF